MRWSPPLKSVEMMFFASTAVTAKETSVGGTWMSSNVPLMESLPPMDAVPKPSCTDRPPSSAAAGLPQRFSSLPSFSKYSWKVRRAFVTSPPAAQILARDSVTAYTAPWNGLHSHRYGS